MKRKSLTLTAFALAFLPAALCAGDWDMRTCSSDNLRGEFAFTAHGTTLPALGLQPGLTGPFASGGFAHFDGMGHFTLSATSSFNGVIQNPPSISGTYSVNTDCSYTSKAENGVTFRAVIVDHGNELLILQTTSGTVISGTARKISHNHTELADRPSREGCQLGLGVYGFLAEGYAGAPVIPGAGFAPLAGVGVINIAPDGTFTATAQRSVGGTLDPKPLSLTGSYATTAACAVKLTFDAGFHFTGIVIDRSDVTFVQTDSGTALRVIAKRL